MQTGLVKIIAIGTVHIAQGADRLHHDIEDRRS